eukprot:s1130_g17.t1
MDSRGIFDSMTRNTSALHGLRSSRAGYELTLSVSQALQVLTKLRWVNGDAQLGDALTKGGAANKMLTQFFSNDQRWQFIHDPDFVAGKKLRKRNLEKDLQEKQDAFISLVQELAEDGTFPWHCETDSNDLRIMGDEISQVTWQQLYPSE